MSVFGYDNNPDNGIRDGDIVSCIFLRRAFPNSYLMQLKNEQKTERLASEALGIEPEPITGKYKDGGVAWEFAITGRINEDSGEIESTLNINESGAIQLPAYNIFGSYIQQTPEFIYNNNLGFPHIIKGGISKCFQGTDNVIIVNNLPGTLPARDFKSGMSATDLTEENRFDNLGLWEQENLRKAGWNMILSKWSQLDEKKALDKLEELISSRLLLYNRRSDDGVIYYLKPQPGMVFNAKVKKRGKFIELISFEWNKESVTYDYYSNGANEVSPDDIGYANELIELKDKQNAVITVTEDIELEGDIPF